MDLLHYLKFLKYNEYIMHKFGYIIPKGYKKHYKGFYKSILNFPTLEVLFYVIF